MSMLYPAFTHLGLSLRTVLSALRGHQQSYVHQYISQPFSITTRKKEDDAKVTYLL